MPLNGPILFILVSSYLAASAVLFEKGARSCHKLNFFFPAALYAAISFHFNKIFYDSGTSLFASLKNECVTHTTKLGMTNFTGYSHKNRS